MVDKNLFLYDLAVVAILKEEAPYLKEWLDYHLAAGVDHFYLYDNESPDNQAEIAKPYIEAGLVDYFRLPGKRMQGVAYNDAFKRFKFQTRYMAFIDLDEFIYPKNNRSIVEVVDETLSRDPKAKGLVINWHIFGSNGQETADYSKGVLERFTRRAPTDWMPLGKRTLQNTGNAHVKTIADPRAMLYSRTPHIMNYFYGRYSVNELGEIVTGSSSKAVTTNTIVINHYHCKSWEEYSSKAQRGTGTTRMGGQKKYSRERFDENDCNDEFDDGILKYYAARKKNFTLESNDDRLARVIKALTETLPTVEDMETALTCRALSTYLREKFPDDERWRTCEEESLIAMLKSIPKMNSAETQLVINELPKLLKLPYPVIKDLLTGVVESIPKVMNYMHRYNEWGTYVKLDYLQELLKLKE